MLPKPVFICCKDRVNYLYKWCKTIYIKYSLKILFLFFSRNQNVTSVIYYKWRYFYTYLSSHHLHPSIYPTCIISMRLGAQDLIKGVVGYKFFYGVFCLLSTRGHDRSRAVETSGNKWVTIGVLWCVNRYNNLNNIW